MYQIIPMEPRHSHAVHTIETLCFSQPWSEAALLSELDNPLACFLLIEQEGTTAAYGGMHCVAEEAYVANIAVHPDYRGRGLGKAITTALIEEAAKRGMSTISLEVRQSNGTAIGLYNSLGFALIGKRPGFYEHPREDALIMTHTIK